MLVLIKAWPNLPDFGELHSASELTFSNPIWTCVPPSPLWPKTERATGNPQEASRLLEKADTGYVTVLRISAIVENVDRKLEIEQKLSQLRLELEAERQSLLRSNRR